MDIRDGFIDTVGNTPLIRLATLSAETGCEINIDDDGSVHIYSANRASLNRAKEIITGMTKEIEAEIQKLALPPPGSVDNSSAP
jgi:polyribonucleotide nucleotidyltransferase